MLAATLLLPAAGASAQGYSNPLSIVIPLPSRAPPPGPVAPTATPGAALAAPIAANAKPLTIGMMLTLTGPDAAPGLHARDGFVLALRQRGGTLGGRPVSLLVVDDELKPEAAAARAKQLAGQDGAAFVIGPSSDSILDAIFRPVTESGAILISPAAPTGAFAGKGCSASFFATGTEATQPHEVIAQAAQDRGMKRAALLVPAGRAGADAIAAFKSRFKAEVVQELAAPSNQTDFQPDLVRLAAAKPDVVLAFMPGAQGVALVRQFRQSALAASVPFLSTFTVDETTLPALQGAGLGLFGAMTWAADMGTPANAQFASAFEANFGYVPSVYAMNAYDAAQLIDSALRKTAANPADKAALRRALRDADIRSPRGPFRFNTNGFPVQDFYLVQAAQRPDGKFTTRIRQRVLSDYPDRFAPECGLK